MFLCSNVYSPFYHFYFRYCSFFTYQPHLLIQKHAEYISCCIFDQLGFAKRAGFIEEATLKNFRLDCSSKKPCDEVIYVCFEKKMLPKLDIFRIISQE